MMARVKAAFPMLFISLELVAFAHASFSLSAGFNWAWLFVLLSSGATLGFFGYLMLQRSGRTSATLPAHLALGAVATAFALWEAVQGGSWAPLVYAAGLGGVGQLLYVFWYSRLGRPESTALRVGAALPAFAIEDEHGVRVASADLLGKPVVWLFFRGNWCPLCMAQIKEVAAMYRQIAERGAVVALVSPQSHAQTRELSRRFDVPFRFFVDPGRSAAAALGIEHKSGLPTGMEALGYEGDTVFPTVVVTDARGRIVACEQTDNYRVRPEPETFLRALDSIGTSSR